MKKTLVLAIALFALLGTACSEIELTEPITQTDLAKLTAETTPAVVPDYPAKMYLPAEAPKKVTFSWADENLKLRYTTDFTTPTAQSLPALDGQIALKYEATGMKGVNQATIRCALFDGATMVSECFTFPYVNATAGTAQIPFVFLVSDPDNLYSHETGILVGGKLAEEAAKNGNPEGWKAGYGDANYFRHGAEWERPAYVSIFSAEGDLLLGQNCGVRVSGAYGRASSVKSLKLFARREYTPDSGVFEFSFWGDSFRSDKSGTPVAWSDNVILRQYPYRIRNEFALAMLEGTHLDRPQQQFVAEFINGQFQSTMTILEDYDLDFYTQHYGFAAEDISLLSGQTHEAFLHAGWYNDDGPEAVYQDYMDILTTAQTTDMTVQANYDALTEKVDMSNYISIIAWRMWCGDTDWNELNNERAWRYFAEGYNPERTDASDGRWRYMIKDMDVSFGNNGSRNETYNDPYYYVDTFSYFLEYPCFYHPCKYNEEFADLLHNRMLTMGQDIFVPDRYNPVLDTIVLGQGRQTTSSLLDMMNTADGIRDWLATRHTAIQGYTENHSGKKVTNFTLSWEGEGEVEICWFAYQNGVTRKYLNNSLVPFAANPAKGWKVGEIELTNCEITEKGYLRITGANANVVVHFEKEEEVPEKGGIVLNEVKFRNTDIDWIELYNSSDKAIVLNGWSIAKETLTGITYPFGNTEIGPGEFALICLTDYSNSRQITGLQAPISIKDGDSLYLFDTYGNVVDELTCKTPSKMIHLGRYPDGGDWVELAHGEMTPAAPNFMTEPNRFFTDVGFDPILVVNQTVVAGDSVFYQSEDGIWYVKKAAAQKALSRYTLITRVIKSFDGDPALADLVAKLQNTIGISLREAVGLPAYVIEEEGAPSVVVRGSTLDTRNILYLKDGMYYVRASHLARSVRSSAPEIAEFLKQYGEDPTLEQVVEDLKKMDGISVTVTHHPTVVVIQ